MTTLRRAALTLVAAAALVGGAARAEDGDAKPADWRGEAAAEGLTPDEIERLAKSKVLVGVRQFNQVFAAYEDVKVPAFVTSDTVLRAYDVLLEECLIRAERSRAARIVPPLRAMREGLARTAASRAQIVVGTALRLLGEPSSGVSDEVAAIVDAEVARVEAADEIALPAWLGPPDEAFRVLDYRAMRPRGFYAGDETLERWFRASAWLSSVPFRLQRDEDREAAIALLGSFGASHAKERVQLETIVGAFARLVGEDGCRSIFSRVDGGLERLRTAAVLPRPTTPDAALLEATQRVRDPRELPSALDVAAGLGSKFAAARICPDPSAPLATVIANWWQLGEGDDLFRRHLRTVAMLSADPDPRAPALFRGDAWAAKTTNTVLAAWAQSRHAWTLNVRESTRYLGVLPSQPGWVEPVPKFFAAFGDVVADTEVALLQCGTFDASVAHDVAVSAVRRFVTLLTDLDRDAGLDRGYAALDGLDSAKRRCFDQAWLSFGREAARAEGGAPGDARSKTVVQAAVLRGARTLATEWLAKDAKAPAMDAAEREAAKLRERWRALAAIVRRLGVLAEKELQGAAFTEDDAKFLHGYALTLAFPMLYDGNIAGMAPPDVPGAVSVFTLIEPGKEPRSLHAAWGMPCAIYVLWPAATGDVLCRGAVVPYREFVRGNRVTDDEWGAMLRSPPAPPAPEWMAPIAVPVRPEKK